LTTFAEIEGVSIQIIYSLFLLKRMYLEENELIESTA